MKTFKTISLTLLLAFSLSGCLSNGSRKSGGTTAAGLDYSLPAEAYKPRMRASDPAGWHHVTFGAVAPSGGVVLSGEGLFGVSSAYVELKAKLPFRKH
ncbi:MAG: hypothetical protein LBS03_11250 [Bacteroidales bacterium]|nr:hypothetical protein [Bacteroidales bacterium]